MRVNALVEHSLCGAIDGSRLLKYREPGNSDLLISEIGFAVLRQANRNTRSCIVSRRTACFLCAPKPGFHR